MRYQLNRNGSWDVEGDFFSIRGCYPSWNGLPVKPLFVRMEENRILYETEKGNLVLYFSMDKDRIRIDCSLENASGIHDIEP
ncbi:MAG: hypothetical protein IIY55_00775, partial [Blautia sp.]|nr:hypothetical protein [Blautia sp.]